MVFLDAKMTKIGRKPIIKVVRQKSDDVATNLESLGTNILILFNEQFEGNEQERTGKLYEFLDKMKDYVISASGIQPQDALIASMNAHS